MVSTVEMIKLNYLTKVDENERIKKLEKVLANLKNELIHLYPSKSSDTTLTCNEKETTEKLLEKIQECILEMVRNLAKKTPPKLSLRNTSSWDNIIYDKVVQLKPVEESTMVEVRFNEKRSLPKFALIIFLLGKIYKLLSTQETCTKRELFYQNCDFITTQDRLDSALNQISCLLKCSLHDMNIFATTKGTIYGPVSLIRSSSSIDCKEKGGTLIPNDITNIIDIKTTAKFIIVIEKDAIFQKCIDDVPEMLSSCIFITGKGFPDINTRLMLKKLWDTLSIPIFALTDPDPYGIDIMCCYRFGSLAMSHQGDQLAVPSIRWLGVLPSEIGNLFDRSACLNDNDKTKLKDLLDRPYVKKDFKLKSEISVLLDNNWKGEIEFVEIVPNYLTNIYLPYKITCSDFI